MGVRGSTCWSVFIVGATGPAGGTVGPARAGAARAARSAGAAVVSGRRIGGCVLRVEGVCGPTGVAGVATHATDFARAASGGGGKEERPPGVGGGARGGCLGNGGRKTRAESPCHGG